MCDSFVVLGNSTADGSVIFGKNSDREVNEAQTVVSLPAADYPAGSRLQCTYIEIPQVSHTHAILISKPFWMWGAEMGANEHGVAIGNEALFTRVEQEAAPGLIGMDLLRLALERSASAQEAMLVITRLLEQFGQSGNCGLTHKFFYQNSFLIADLNEAWVLETAGRQWAAERVKDVRSISNGISIGNHWDLASADLIHYAVDRGWCKRREDFHFARCYSEPLYTRLSKEAQRRLSTTDRLRASAPHVTIKDAFAVLRSHGGAAWTPSGSITDQQVCMHAAFGPVRNSQTTGSLAAHLTAGQEPTFWVTATAAPCTSVFKPVWISAGVPDTGPEPTARYCPDSLWWQHENLHRSVLRDYWRRLELFRQDRDQLEELFLNAESKPKTNRRVLSEQCFEQAFYKEFEWLEKVKTSRVHSGSLLYRIAWANFNRQAKIQIS
ncbi:dipeptidase [Longilinea arvoryzae]|uniref:Dipeptidase n=1 Tax=Longilinea arvoryzae TaxID=360412 RepID=A0A0S7BAA7_9CHLR|nr:C69 family dipeptidase [Longilinea arvoryzae]GAP14423.1 dipeptidase [Longilinea arvoryzae]